MWHTGRMTATQPKPPPRPKNESPPQGAPAPEDDPARPPTKSGIPRGRFFYITEGYGLHRRGDD